MANDFNEKDPMYQQGKKQHEQDMDRTTQRLHQAGEMEHAIKKRLSRFLLFGVPGLLWSYSRPALFLYVAPFWIYVLYVMSITAGLSSDPTYALTFYGVGALLLVSMATSMIYGFRKALGLVRGIALLQMGMVTLFVSIATYRAINAPPREIPFEPKTMECGIAMLVMFLLFSITVIADLIRVFMHRREQE